MKYVSFTTVKMNSNNFFFFSTTVYWPLKVKLTAVLLHHGNKLPSVPAAHAANMTESYENTTIKDPNTTGNLWGFKDPVLLLGYTKFCCFLCECYTSDRKHHYLQKQWPKRESHIPGQKKCSKYAVHQPWKSLFTSAAHQTWTHKILSRQWIKILLDLNIWKTSSQG